MVNVFQRLYEHDETDRDIGGSLIQFNISKTKTNKNTFIGLHCKKSVTLQQST